jgi:hypothetical protein
MSARRGSQPRLQAVRLASSALSSELPPQSCSSRVRDATGAELRGCQRHLGLESWLRPSRASKTPAQFQPSRILPSETMDLSRHTKSVALQSALTEALNGQLPGTGHNSARGKLSLS